MRLFAEQQPSLGYWSEANGRCTAAAVINKTVTDFVVAPGVMVIDNRMWLAPYEQKVGSCSGMSPVVKSPSHQHHGSFPKPNLTLILLRCFEVIKYYS